MENILEYDREIVFNFCLLVILWLRQKFLEKRHQIFCSPVKANSFIGREGNIKQFSIIRLSYPRLCAHKSYAN